MNKKLFVSATALTAVAVAGVVYYRHQLLEELDKRLHPRFQDPEMTKREVRDLNRFEDALKEDN